MRELTKTHEEAVRGSAAELLARFENDPPLGEFVLCIAGTDNTARANIEGPADDDAVRGYYGGLTAGGAAPKEALKQTMERFGLTRNDAYKIIKVSGGNS